MSRETLKATMESAKSSRDGVFSGAEGDAAPISLLKTAYSKNITIEEWNQLVVDMNVVLRELSADSALLTTVYSMASQLCDDADDYYNLKKNAFSGYTAKYAFELHGPIVTPDYSNFATVISGSYSTTYKLPKPNASTHGKTYKLATTDELSLVSEESKENLNYEIEQLTVKIEQGVLIAKKALMDGSGNPISDTYETKADSANKFSSIVSGATIVGKAYKDGNGNVISSYYVPVSSVVNNLNSTSATSPLSAMQGNQLNAKIQHIYTLLGSDDTSLDTLQEVVDYIKNHSSVLEAITISKASISDLENGSIVVGKAIADEAGNDIQLTYPTIASLTGGSLQVAKAIDSVNAVNATNDALGRKIDETYAPLSSISGVSLTASEVDEIYKSI